MKLTKATDYGLLLLVHLTRLRQDQMTSVKKVASEHQISERFLANIVNRLVNAGILDSIRGVNGGIRLARSPGRISVREVVEALEGPIELFDCQRRPGLCPQQSLCAMQKFWQGVKGKLLGDLDGAMIGDFLPPAAPHGASGPAA